MKRIGYSSLACLAAIVIAGSIASSAFATPSPIGAVIKLRETQDPYLTEHVTLTEGRWPTIDEMVTIAPAPCAAMRFANSTQATYAPRYEIWTMRSQVSSGSSSGRMRGAKMAAELTIA